MKALLTQRGKYCLCWADGNQCGRLVSSWTGRLSLCPGGFWECCYWGCRLYVARTRDSNGKKPRFLFLLSSFCSCVAVVITVYNVSYLHECLSPWLSCPHLREWTSPSWLPPELSSVEAWTERRTPKWRRPPANCRRRPGPQTLSQTPINFQPCNLEPPSSRFVRFSPLLVWFVIYRYENIISIFGWYWPHSLFQNKNKNWF